MVAVRIAEQRGQRIVLQSLAPLASAASAAAAWPQQGNGERLPYGIGDAGIEPAVRLRIAAHFLF
jgi:hypothetical protein